MAVVVESIHVTADTNTDQLDLDDIHTIEWTPPLLHSLKIDGRPNLALDKS